MNWSYSEWLEIVFGVPQDSTFGPHIFKNVLADLFFAVDDTEIPSCMGRNTPYISGKDIEEVI